MLPRLLGFAFLVLAWAPAAQAWHSSAPAHPPPPVPDCDEVMARYGDQAIWVGRFSGRYRNASPGGTSPYGAVGCFLSEAECRRWLGQNLSFAGSPLYVMSCRPAAKGARRY